ncbi:MAG: tol-pal system-associated acyl-CoA thioesterase [Betaproteobacteria bacterium]|nr:MAG: tol-pal system-associated acyl-CoA thioesterase [Betaproteobacteria bacterium]
MVQSKPDPAMTKNFTWPVRVYYEDTDTGGVVYYANYLKFFERARTEWLRSFGLNQDKLAQEDGLIFVVRRALLDFERPARLDDLLEVTVELQKLARVYLDLTQEARCGSQVMARAQIRVACLNLRRFKPVEIPQSLRESIQQ